MDANSPPALSDPPPARSSSGCIVFALASFASLLLSWLPVVTTRSLDGLYVPLIFGGLAAVLFLVVRLPIQALAVFLGSIVGPITLFVFLCRLAVGT